jgi:hypothetical protein
VVTMAALIIWIDYRQRQRGVRIHLGGPEPTPAPQNGEGNASEASRDDQQGISLERQARVGDPNVPPQNLHDGEPFPARFPQ